jgi:hypothetical protein
MEPLPPDPGGSHDNFRAPTISVLDMLPQSKLPPAFDEPSIFNQPAPTMQSNSELFPSSEDVSGRLFAEVDTDHDSGENKTSSHSRQHVTMSVEDVSSSVTRNRGGPFLRGRETSGGLAEGLASGTNSLRGRALDAFSSTNQRPHLQFNTLSKPDMDNRSIGQVVDFISLQRMIPLSDQSTPEPGLQDPTVYTQVTGAYPEGLSKNTAIDLTSDDDSVPPLFLSQCNQPRRIRPSNEVPTAKQARGKDTRTVLFRNCKTASKKTKEPDVQLLVGHRDLSYWKDKHYQELGIDAEYQLVLRMKQTFKPASIQTIVPDRYLRPMHKQGHRRPAFPGVIVAGGRPVEAIRKAYEEHTPVSQDFRRLVLWTDGSGCRKSSGRGMGVVVRTTLPGGVGWSPWMVRGYVSFGKRIETWGVEGLAMVKAIDLACEMIRAEPSRFAAVAIYTDALTVLDQLRSHSPRALCERIVKKAMGLRREGSNPTLTLHWCPGHSKVRNIGTHS